MPGPTFASVRRCEINCRVSDDQTESYLSATRCQPSCSNRAKSSRAVMIPDQAWRCRKQITLRTAKRLQLLQRKFDWLFFLARNELVSLYNSGASIPTQQRIVVSGR